MVTLRFELLAGRLHATPWSAHVNEGQVEWPPSPWRLLRTLLAASFRVPGRDERAVRALLLRLGDAHPSYALPPATFSHTRAYLSQEAGRDGKMVFDAFAAFDRHGGDAPAFEVDWPVTLDASERDLLSRLLAEVGYLGRAESWVRAALVEQGPRPEAWDRVEPSADGDVEIWTLVSEQEFHGWRSGMLHEGWREKDLPRDRFDALAMEPLALQKARWSSPPGAVVRRWIWHRGGLASRRPRPHGGTRPELARFALTGRVLPRLERALSLGDRLRRALMSCARNEGDGSTHEAFSGKEEGQAMRGGRHAYFVAADDDGDGAIDHLYAWHPRGFDHEAVSAIRRLRALWSAEGAVGESSYEITLVHLGAPEVLSGLDTIGGRRNPARSALFGTSRVWKSETPFVLFRHPKPRRRRDLPPDQVVLAIKHHEHLAAADVVDVRGWTRGETEHPRANWEAHRFLRVRREGGGSRGGDGGFGFTLEFARPVGGPFFLGYGAHFGLGSFRAVEEP